MVATYRCNACGGNMAWNIQKQTYECSSCRTPGDLGLEGKTIVQHPIGEYHTHNQGQLLEEGETVVVCSNCGSEVTFTESTTATTCPMCSSPQVDVQKQLLGVPPDGIIPFKLDKANAQEQFKKWVKSRWFAPNSLKKSYQQGKLDGIYVPFWTYDTDSSAYYTGQGGTQYTEEVEDDEGNTTYETRTDWEFTSGYVYDSFDDIAVSDGSDRINEVIKGILPYSTEGGAYPYTPAFISGMGAEHYSKGAPTCFEEAEKIIKDKMHSLAYNDILTRYDSAQVSSVDVSHQRVEYKNMLLPTWISSFAHGGKEYTYMINGETGKVNGKRPYSIPKIVSAVLVGLLILGGIFFWYQSTESNSAFVYPESHVAVVSTQVHHVANSGFGSGENLSTAYIINQY